MLQCNGGVWAAWLEWGEPPAIPDLRTLTFMKFLFFPGISQYVSNHINPCIRFEERIY